jgi:hypothetical protein
MNSMLSVSLSLNMFRVMNNQKYKNQLSIKKTERAIDFYLYLSIL